MADAAVDACSLGRGARRGMILDMRGWISMSVHGRSLLRNSNSECHSSHLTGYVWRRLHSQVSRQERAVACSRTVPRQTSHQR